jgi:DNA helicase-2/ATP-dependent DNA helicase PcrA
MPSSLSQRVKQFRTGVPSHVIVIARAGTGKTTTLVEGLKVVQGLKPTIIPSQQQESVWAELEKSKGANSVCFAAFNKSIQMELQKRVPAGVRAVTMHGLGFGAVNQAFKLNKTDGVTGFKTRILLEEITGKESKNMDNLVVTATEKLVGLCKANLVEPTYDSLMDIACAYDIELNDSVSEIFDYATQVLTLSKNDVARHGFIDFNDMVWLPVVHNLPVPKYDLLLIDEAQDLTRCQQELAMKSGRRLVLCGDPAQAIYGFAGADSQSMPRMQAILQETPAGCVLLPLNVTRRCGKKIVAEANVLVPDFEAHESTGEGQILHMCKDKKNSLGQTAVGPFYHDHIEAGDMVLCRTNAPLVSECFRLIRAKKKANIQGREIGTGLIKMIQRFRAKNLQNLSEKLEAWFKYECEKENKKKFPSESRIISLMDKRDCLDCFIQEAKNLPDVTRMIESIFSDTSKGGILLSSIHQAKGLEARRVFFLLLKEAQIPHPMARTAAARGQEYNLKYVAITRASETLVYVSN